MFYKEGNENVESRIRKGVASSKGEGVRNDDFVDSKINIPEILENIFSQNDPKDALDMLSLYLHYPDKVYDKTLNNKDISDRFCQLLSSSSCSLESKKYILECFASFWFYTENLEEDNVWVEESTVESVIALLSSNDRDLRPIAYFALSNFASIDEKASVFLAEREVIEKLLSYLSSWTSHHHTRAAISLCLNLLNFRNEDIYNSMIRFIPKFRCHLSNFDAVIRNQVCICLIKLCEYEPAKEMCIQCEVPREIYTTIVQNPAGFVQNIFKLILVFLDSPARSNFITEEFIDAIAKILEMSMEEYSKNERKLGDVFSVLLEIEEEATDLLINRNIPAIAISYVENGFSTMKMNAGVLVAKILSNCRKNVKDELINENGAVEAVCNIVSLLNTSEDQKTVYYLLYSLILTDFDRFSEVLVDNDVLEVIDNTEDDFSTEIREITDGMKTVFEEHNNED